MALQWPKQLAAHSHFESVFDLAQDFEIHCAKVYDHAALHPTDVVSADYVMQFVSHAYRAVHSLHMQKKALEFCDLSTATADLQRNAIKFRETRDLDPVHNTHDETASPSPDETEENPRRNTLADLINGNFEDDEEDEDSDWDESEEETDDEYYEYCEGSDAESELDGLEAIAEAEQEAVEDVSAKVSPELDENAEPAEPCEKKNTSETSASPPPVPILQDQAMHDRITAALQKLSLPCEEVEPASSEPVESAPAESEPATLEQIQSVSNRSIAPSTTPSTQYTQSEATAVQTNSDQDAPPLEASTVAQPEKPAQKTSFDAVRLQRKLSKSSSPADIPRRLKTVCHKYVRRAMVPIRAKAH